MSRTVIHSLSGAVLVGASIVLLVPAIRSHREYARAHVAAYRILATATDPSTLPGSLVAPEPFFRQAQRLSFGVYMIAAVALVAALRTRRLAWRACFLICGLLAAIAFMQTGIRY